MLVLSRHRDESIKVGDTVTVKVIDIRGDKVRLGIDAPAFVPVHREEVYDAIQTQRATQRHRDTDVDCATDGILFIDAAMLDRLRAISRLTHEYHRQLDVLASECCEILGQPNDSSDEADLCRQIVDHSSDPDRVVAQLLQMLAVNNANRELGQVDDVSEST